MGRLRVKFQVKTALPSYRTTLLLFTMITVETILKNIPYYKQKIMKRQNVNVPVHCIGGEANGALRILAVYEV